MKTLNLTSLREREYEARHRLMELESSARCLQDKVNEGWPGAEGKLLLIYSAKAVKAAVEWLDVLTQLGEHDKRHMRAVLGSFKGCHHVKRTKPTLWHSFELALFESEQAHKRMMVNQGDRMFVAILDEACDRLKGLAIKVEKSLRGAA